MAKKKKSSEKNLKNIKAVSELKSEEISKETKAIKEEVISVVLFMLAVFMFVSIRNFHGLPEDEMFIGIFGTYLMKGLQLAFGSAGVLVSFFLLMWAIHIGILKKLWSVRMWGISLLAISILVTVSVSDIPGGMNAWEAGQRAMGGGYVGGGLSYILISLIGGLGTSIILTLAIILSLIMILEMSISEIALVVWNNAKKIGNKLNKLLYYEGNVSPVEPKSSREAVIINPSNDELIQENLPFEEEKQSVAEKTKKAVETKSKKEKADSDLLLSVPNKESGHYSYNMPSVDILNDAKSERLIDKKNIKDSISVLEDTFGNFGVDVKVNTVSCGPAVTRYELTPAPGVKVSKIISLTDDLQLSLAAPGIRIEAPIPGKSAIGIEVPNASIRSVGLKSILSSSAFKKVNSPLAFVLGEDIAGNPVVAKLSDMPHLLIAGSTGSGKSVCLNCIIMSLLFNANPEELKLVLIDPKMVELTVYNGIPHLMTPVVTDPKKASVILRWMTTEMEKRYKTFADQGVRDIYRYNQMAEEKMPFIVIIIDELADLMMVAPAEVEDSICRLAQMARAAGMHLIVATQRPSVDVVTGIIKANIPSRIAFAVSSQADSRTILDIGGAEKLLGKGDMLFFPVGAIKPYRVQGSFVSDSEIEETVKYIVDEMPDEQIDELKDIEASMENIDMDYGDELFWDAVQVFVDGQKASVSLLQRRLRIGYARAARLVDLMEERGIVSEADNNKKREILIDAEQLAKLQNNNLA